MIILRAGLYAATATACLVGYASWHAGYPVEVASVRGLVAFIAMGFVAYLAELVVVTAPPASGGLSSVRGDRDPDLQDDDAADEFSEPMKLPAIRAERDAAARDHRAA